MVRYCVPGWFSITQLTT